MIRYDLKCDRGHEFDGWFRDSSAYDAQAAEGLIACVECGSTKIDKQLMTPGIPAKHNRQDRRQTAKQVFSSALDPRQQKLMQMVRELRKAVEENSEYVGDRFTEEARRIHYDEAEKRGIYGEATATDAKELAEEGIEVHPLPAVPEDGN